MSWMLLYTTTDRDAQNKHDAHQYDAGRDTHELHDEDGSEGMTSEDSEDNVSWPSDEESDKDLNNSEEGSEAESSEHCDDDTEGEYDLTGDYKMLSDVLGEVIELQPSEDVVSDRDMQSTLQICLLSCYGCVHDLSDIEFDVLVTELAVIGSKLSDTDLFSLSKALCLLCKEVLSKSTPKMLDCAPSSYPYITDQFLCDLTLASDKSSSKACLEICLSEFISRRLKCTRYKEVTLALLTTVTTSLWSLQDVMTLLENAGLINDGQTFLHVLQLALTNQIDFKHIRNALANNTSALIDILQRVIITEAKSDRSVEQILANIAETKSIVSNTLEQAGIIVRTVQNELKDTFSVYETLTNKELVALIRQYMLENHSNRHVVLSLKFLCCAVKECMKYFPTNSQLLALSILILSRQQKTSRLLQVLSGEGKSTIIAMFAAILGLQGYKVDIITSSPELAQRDSADWGKFLERFNLSSAHNTETEELLSMRQDEADQERMKIYEHDVVYGTVSSFSADYLRQKFEMRNIRPKRLYRVAIVDEVDMLMLDEGVQFTYLSHQVPVLRHIEPVLALVWSEVCQNTPLVTTTGATLFAGVPKLIHNIIFEGINRALCGGLSDSRQLLHVAVQE